MVHVGRSYAWEKSYPAGMRWDSPIATSTLQELLDRAVAEYGDRPALEYQDRCISYRGLGDHAARAAAAFRHMGIDRGHAVALYMPNTPWHPIVFFGVLRTGAHIVHLSPLDAERELIHKLTDSGARTIVTVNLSGVDAKALKLAAAGHVDRVIVADDGVWSASSPSPRLPSGRLRPSEPVIGPAEGGTRWTGYGEGRGEGAFPHAQTRGDAPSPQPSPRKRGEGAGCGRGPGNSFTHSFAGYDTAFRGV